MIQMTDKFIRIANTTKNKVVIFCLLMGLMLIVGLRAEAGRYFDETEIATFSIPDSTTGDTFYVDTANGSDSYNGLSPTFTTGTTGPFKTLARCFDRYRSNNVVGGDVVKVRAGIYRESMNLQFTSAQISSLTESAPLVIGPYGDGEVIIDPSSTSQSWNAYDSDIFWADWPNATYDPAAVIMNGDFKPFRDKQSLGELTQYGLWFFDLATRRIYVHTDGTDPATLDPVITYNNASAEQYAVKTSGYPYIHLFGLTMRGAARYGFTDYPGSLGVKLEKCTIKWNNSTGGRIFGEYSVVGKNHVWGNMLYNWPRGRRWAANGGWGQGITIGGYGLAEGNIVHDNGGEGMGVYGGTGHVIFQDNISYDNWSVGLYMDSAGYCTFQRNLVYAHNPDTADIVEEWQLPQWILDAGAGTIAAETNKIIGRLRQEGIMVGDETATNPTAQSIGFKALNNILIGNRRGITTYGQAVGAGLNNYIISGNTIIMPQVAPSYGVFAGMELYARDDNTDSVIKNNLVYSNAPGGQTQPLVNFGSTAAMSGVDFNNNVYFSVNSATPFKSGVYPNELNYDFDGWRAYVPLGYDTNSVYADPQFLGTAGSFTSSDYLLSSGSPAMNIGATLSDSTTDFNNFARVGLFDVGALEYGSVFDEGGADTTPPASPHGLSVL